MTPIERKVHLRNGKIVHEYQFPPLKHPQQKRSALKAILDLLAKSHETLIDLNVREDAIEGVHAITANHPEYFDSVRFTEESPHWQFGEPHPKWIQPPRWMLDPEGELTAKQILLRHHEQTQFETVDGCPYAIVPANPEIPLEEERAFLKNGCGSDLFALEMTLSGNTSHEGFIIPHPEEHLAVQRMVETLRQFHFNI